MNNWIEKWLHIAVETVAGEVGKHSPLAAYVSENGATTYGRERPDKFRILGKVPYATIGGYGSRALGVVKPSDKLEPLPDNDGLRALLANPNPLNSIRGLLYETQTYLSRYGKSFIWKVRNSNGVVCELVPLHPHLVMDLGDSYEICVGDGGRVIPKSDMIKESQKINAMGFSDVEDEEHAKDVALAGMSVPKGILETGGSYGAFQASYSAFCSFCINPILAVRGAAWTKGIGSEFSTESKKAVIWWDDITPMEAATIEADIQAGLQSKAMTVAEVRRLRGKD